MLYDLHVCCTGQMFSFRHHGSDLDERESVFHVHRYGAGPHAVLTSYGIQGGNGYFHAIRERFADVMKDAYAIQGFVWRRHVKLYRRAMRGIAHIDILFSGKPYGDDGPIFDWIFARKLNEDGTIQGPATMWDKHRSGTE